jgi:hypothetical protein
LAELFVANTPISQEMLYLNLAEVDTNLEMRSRRVCRYGAPGVSSNFSIYIDTMQYYGNGVKYK